MTENEIKIIIDLIETDLWKTTHNFTWAINGEREKEKRAKQGEILYLFILQISIKLSKINK